MSNPPVNSEFQIVTELDEKTWRTFLDQHPSANIFHTPEMFRVFSLARGHRPLFFAALDRDGQPLALLLPVQVTLPGPYLRRLTTRSIAYGGVVCSPDLTGAVALEALLRAYTKQTGRQALFTELRHLSYDSTLQPPLYRCGFVFEEHLNFLIDLCGSQNEVFGRIGPRTRKHIRRALRKGTVAVEQIGHPALLEDWYGLVWKSYRAARVPLADRSLFEAAFNILHPLGMVKFWLARVGSVYVAASAELLYRDVIYGWYCGLDRAYAAEVPGEILMWQILSWGAQQGYKTYDFGGAGRPGERYGVRDFKAKFGGQLVYLGRNTCVHAPRLLKLSRLGYRFMTGSFRSWRDILNLVSVPDERHKYHQCNTIHGQSHER